VGNIKLNKILVIDLEATCWDGGIAPNSELQKYESEIIEIGVCELAKDHMGNYYSSSTYSYYVKPIKHTVSDFCHKLTGISQEMLDKHGMTLEMALHQFNRDYSPKHKTLVTWGNYDKMQIIKECNEKKIEDKYNFSDTLINAKNLFAIKYKLEKEIGLGSALKHLNMEFIGDQHSGVDDALNTARLFLEIIK